MAATAAVAALAACCTTTGFAFMMTPPGPAHTSSPTVHVRTSGGTKFVQPDQRYVVCLWLCACCQLMFVLQRSVVRLVELSRCSPLLWTKLLLLLSVVRVPLFDTAQQRVHPDFTF